MFFVVTDSHSKLSEVSIMSSITAGQTINVLRELFARFGIPLQLVSDNGPQLLSKEFKQFMSVNGVKHIRSSPYHPASNGAAKRMVQTVKLALQAPMESNTLEVLHITLRQMGRRRGWYKLLSWH